MALTQMSIDEARDIRGRIVWRSENNCDVTSWYYPGSTRDILEGSVKCRYLSEAECRLEEKDLCKIMNIKMRMVGGDTNGALVLPRQMPFEAKTADWFYTLNFDDVTSEWKRQMLLQLLQERQNTASETLKER